VTYPFPLTLGDSLSPAQFRDDQLSPESSQIIDHVVLWR